MRKCLLSTSALVAGSLMVVPALADEREDPFGLGGDTAKPAPATNEPITLGLAGYMNNYFAVGDFDNKVGTDRNATGLFSEGEIHFLGETTLDNGITFGAVVQLESYGNTGDTIDEDFAYIEGGFGRLNIGSENTAAYLMHYSAPFVGVPINSGWVTTFVPPDGVAGGGFRTPRISTFLDIGNDENLVSYFTPRLAGFQLGASYAPAVVASANGKDFPPYADTDTEFSNGISVGVNFVESFEAFELAVSGGYRRAEAPETPGVAGNLSGEDGDLEQWSAGLNLGIAGFTLGGSYAQEDSSRFVDGEAWDVGMTYEFGRWAVGATYFQSEIDGASFLVKDLELQAIEAGVSYVVGPGIIASASVLHASYEQDVVDPAFASAVGLGAEEADGTVGVLGLKLLF